MCDGLFSYHSHVSVVFYVIRHTFTKITSVGPKWHSPYACSGVQLAVFGCQRVVLGQAVLCHFYSCLNRDSVSRSHIHNLGMGHRAIHVSTRMQFDI